MQPQLTSSRKGFTLVELSLSIVFISILSITMVMIINESISTYRRGLTLNQINTVGMDLTDDMRAAVQNSSAKSISDLCHSIYISGSENSNADQAKNCSDDPNGPGFGFVSVTRTANVTARTANVSPVGNVPVFGAFCTGDFSYIWNSGYFSDSSSYQVENVQPASLTYKTTDASGRGNSNATTANNFRLLKVKDEMRRVCLAATGTSTYDPSPTKINSNFNISSFEPISEAPIEVLEGNNLAIYDLDISRPATSNADHNIFYSVSFILGTVQGGININASGNFCATPEDYPEVANFDYCSINKFNFAAQATGG